MEAGATASVPGTAPGLSSRPEARGPAATHGLVVRLGPAATRGFVARLGPALILLNLLSACVFDGRSLEDLDEDGVPATRDCDDRDAAVGAGDSEVCNGVDDDCDRDIDEGVTTTWYVDVDEDGFGDHWATAEACSPPEGYVADDSDCDDGRNDVHPDAPEVCDEVDNDCDEVIDETTPYYWDDDGDGYGNSEEMLEACEQPTGYVPTDGDCNDGEAGAHPLALEICDGLDNDCDGSVDDGVGYTWYADVDDDGYGDADDSIKACTQPDGYVADDSDCDDTSALVQPGATEVCNDMDDDCDGDADEGLSVTYYYDNDGDGHGNDAFPKSVECDSPAPKGYVAQGGDCDDQSNVVYPGAAERCDDYDNDCDGAANEDDEDIVDADLYYVDSDGDRYGSPDDEAPILSCSDIGGRAPNNTDCDDANESRNPGMSEVCDPANTDEDCDGNADDADLEEVLNKSTYYRDDDGDGYGDPEYQKSLCDATEDYPVEDKTDCDDGLFSINPGASEQCNEKDDDCDGEQDEGTTKWYRDLDADTYGDDKVSQCKKQTGFVNMPGDCNDSDTGINPGAAEVCDTDDAIDEDCDGLIDDDDVLSEGTWPLYPDVDGDRFGDKGADPYLGACHQSGYVADASDCDDNNASINPDATEICDGLDNDCDKVTDPTAASAYYDVDCDGFGDPNSKVSGCDLPDSYVTNGDDCNDANPNINPGAMEVCDSSEAGESVDEDCDGLVNDADDNVSDATKHAYFKDYDGDGYGSTDQYPGILCDAPEDDDDYVANNDDCDDAAYTSYPGAAEACDGADNDCDGVTDDGVGVLYYEDGDRDGFGDSSNGSVLCDTTTVPDGMVTEGGDCNEIDPGEHPMVVTPSSSGSSSAAYTSIQEALDDPLNCGLVLLDPGSYEESISIGSGLTLKPRTADETKLTGDGQGPVIEVTSATTVRVEGLVISGNADPVDSSGAGISIYNSIDVTLEGLTLSGLVVEGDESIGGAIAVVTGSSEIIISDCVVKSNKAPNGGGIAVDGSTVSIEHCTLEDNEATATFGVGGGLYLSGSSSVTVVDSVLSENQAYSGGGAAAEDGELEIAGSYVGYNRAWVYGGGIDNAASVSGCSFVGNGPTSSSPILVGGALVLRDDGATVTNSAFLSNTAQTAAAIAAYDAGDTKLLHNTLVDNTAQDTIGMAIWVVNASGFTFVNNILYEQSESGADSQVYVLNPSGTVSVQIERNDIYAYGTAFVAYNAEVPDIGGEEFNIAEDPLFMSIDGEDPETWDIRLSSSSPCIDVGSYDAGFGGYDTDGSLPDLGTYGGSGAPDELPWYATE